MRSLRQLLESPTLAPLLGYLVRPELDPLVELVAIIEEPGEIRRVGEHAIVLLTRAGSATANTYRFDIALRVARARGIAAVVLYAVEAESITPTSAAIANRSGIAILGTGLEVDLAELALAIGRELGGGSELALLRAHAALRAIGAHPSQGRVEALVQHAGDALGVPIKIVTAEPSGGPRAPIVVENHVEGWLVGEPQEGDLAMGLDIVLHAASVAAAQALGERLRADELPIQSREEVLTELLAAPPHARPAAVHRARTLGVPIDGWHVAVRLEVDQLAYSGDGELAAYEARLRLARATLQALRTLGGEWHSARAGALVLVRMYADDPGAGASSVVAKEVDRALARVRSRLPATLIRCGVGSAYVGADGLWASSAEAGAAVTVARTSARANLAVPFDSVGLRRTLVEWYASDTARDAVGTVLAPLTKLGPPTSERLIQTLHVYLDQRGSFTKTAKLLNLHRNAVAYRINRIFELLDVDRDNPDDLLLLQLACRAREIA
ncbi:MAG TPA: helix-turn-helix domain-containing protein [Solirubrobacteraceae bacterium]|nr:helix-turn-helix domain-containing protein [Solirubrobacteraceae bacterium]